MVRRLTMNVRIILVLLMLMALLMMIFVTVHAAESTVFQVPRMDGIIVDGCGDDWAEQGFRVEFLADPSGRVILQTISM